MKKLIILVILPILLSFSQEKQSLESKLREVYSIEICDQILKNPAQKKYFEVFLFHSLVLTKEKIESAQNHEILTNVSLMQNKGESITISAEDLIKLIETRELNVLQLEIERHMDNNLIFRLGETDYVLTLLSHSQINKLAKK